VLIALAVLWGVAIVVAVRSARRERALNESAVVEEDSTPAV
jgi:hypothetical protein